MKPFWSAPDRPRKSHLTADDRRQVKELWDLGVSTSEIARTLGRSRAAVARAIEQFQRRERQRLTLQEQEFQNEVILDALRHPEDPQLLLTVYQRLRTAEQPA